MAIFGCHDHYQAVIKAKDWKPRYTRGCDGLTGLRFDEGIVSGRAEEWFDKEWDACSCDPESAEGGDVFMSTYKHWAGRVSKWDMCNVSTKMHPTRAA